MRLGEKRPEHLLPRKDEGAPPPPAKPAPVAAPAAAAAPAQPSPKLPSAKERIAELSKVSDALARLKKKVAPAGDPEGSPDGEVSDISRAILGNKFRNNFV